MSTTERRIGRYLLLEPVGRGAMAVVYRAEDPRINRTVAVKVLGTADGSSPLQIEVARERFKREGQAAASIDHPNVIRVFDVGEDDESHAMYIVMEFVSGPTLETILGEGRLDFDRAATIIGQVASGLDAAHARGIVHRDVKPANVLVTVEGTVKIADFGITQVATSALTLDMRALGTPAYTSPEQVMGKAVDSRADLFSLGVLSYEMLGGLKPFGGDDIASIAHAIVYEKPVPISVVNPGLPRTVDEVLDRILAKDPANRFASGKEFHEALLASVSDVALATSLPASGPPQPQRAAWTMASVVLLIAAVLMFLSWGTRPVPTAAIASSPTEPARAFVAPAPPIPKAPENTGKPAATKKSTPHLPEKPVSGAPSAPKPVPTAHPTSTPVQPQTRPVAAKAPSAAPAPTTNVTIRFAHRLRRGTLIVFLDGRRIFDEKFSKSRMAMVQTTIWDPLKAPVGGHTLNARVKGEDGKTYVSDTYEIEFPGGQEIELRIGLKGDALTVEKRAG